MTENESSMTTNTVTDQADPVAGGKYFATINDPAKNSTELLGVPFNVGGQAGNSSDSGGGVDGVRVGIDGRFLHDVDFVGSPREVEWGLSVTLNSLGSHTIDAGPLVSDKHGTSKSDSVTVQVMPATFTVVLLSPAPDKNGVCQIGVTPLEIKVSVTSNGPAPTDVQYRWDGGVSTPLSPPTSAEPNWTAAIPLPSTVPGAGVAHTLDLRATNDFGTVGTLEVTVKAVDLTAPVVMITSPANGQFVPGTRDKASIDVTISVSDNTPPNELSSGISRIIWSVNGTTVGTTELSAPFPQSGQWTATLPLDPLDIEAQQIMVTAFDSAGNSHTVGISVTVVLPLQFNDLSEQSYLGDLIDFACLRLLTGQGNAANITPGHLQEAFHQDFQATRNAGPNALGSVHLLRLVVESLFDYLEQPVDKAPIASWPLTEKTIDTSKSPPTAEDVAVTGEDDKIHGAITFVPGPNATFSRVLSFDGTYTYVQVENPGRLVIRRPTGPPQLTLATWINPGQAQQNGVIAGMDQRYLLARFVDGTIQLALWVNNTFVWENTDLMAPVGQWSHVAMVYDGEDVNVYLNGIRGPRSFHLFAAQLGDKTDFRIGSQQSAAAYFQGAICDVMLWDRVLSAWDIATLYNAPPPQDEVWIDDALPDDALQLPAEDGWNWVASDPTPYHGSACHQSKNLAGAHGHYVEMPHEVNLVNRGDRLFTYVYLDEHNPPDEVMLSWLDAVGRKVQSAFWGQDSIPKGSPGSHSYIGPIGLDWLGRWVRLEVPAASVGLEDVAVQGFGFTLYNGRAAWDYSGKTSWTTQVAASGSTAAAYRALMLALGTSYDELRLARSASSGTRTALASRLGFDLTPGRPDELDRLLKRADSVTDADLERLFGLLSPDASVLSPPVANPALQTWRQFKLRKQWKLEDLGGGATDFMLPIVDPDVVQLSELVNPSAGQPAFELWQSRTGWIAEQTTALAKERSGPPTELAALNAVIATVPALNGVNLDKLQQQLNAGHQIDAALSQCHLTMAGFRRIMELRALAASLAAGDTLEPSEWEDVYAILVQVEKVTAYPQWRDEEHGLGLLLSPNFFKLTPPGTSITLRQWRANWDTRLAWADRLQARSDQLADLEQGLQAARFAAEVASLPLLRNALVSAIGSGKDVSDQLTEQLFIDVESGASLKITPLDQAIETLQSALEAIHTGAIASTFDNLSLSPAASWVLAEDSQKFETEWQYMGSYANWLGAMTTFFFPENVLDPSLLAELDSQNAQAPSSAFTDLLIRLANAFQTGTLDPQHEANTFKDSDAFKKILKDVKLPDEALKADLKENELANFRTKQISLKPPSLTYEDQNWEWAREAFFLGPLQLALALQRLGRYQEALDWLRTIYNHNAASSASPDIGQDQRAIFVGFGLDQGDLKKRPPSLTRPPGWLLYDFNPHVIATLPGRVNTHLRYTLFTIARCLLDFADAEFTRDTPESRAHARQLYLKAEWVLSTPQVGVSDAGVPPNPLRDSLYSRAQTNLTKLHAGLNIAGIQRPLAPADDPQGIPPPTPYRYATLVSRAQQLLTSAEDVERQYLAALQSRDVEQEKILQASQGEGIAIAHAQEMHDQATAAAADVQVYTDQQKRANQQAQTYGTWISQGPNDSERAMLDDQMQAATAKDWQTSLQATAAAASAIGAIIPDPLGIAAGLASATADIGAGVAGVIANDAEFHAQQNAFYGSLERQTDSWKLNQAMASWDSTIAGDQIATANARKMVALDEASIADAQAQNAIALLNFLITKFTNVALYSWMVDVLGPIYRHQLRLTTATALLAQRQLAFDRQQRPPTFIMPDYVVNVTAPDLLAAQSGLTGSARLLSDLNDLNNYAFSTDQRKLQLTQSFSLAQLAPVDFIRFRGSGDMTFTIPLPLFDQNFPGHYLRLIRRLRVSIVGLIPPTPGIRATLSSSGISSVVVPGDTFQTLRMARAPETVSYTSPFNATGTFELDAQPELMNSFEGSGVDMAFRLTMPKASNPFNYGSLADVIVIYEYTAMVSPDYARQVIRRMPRRISNAIDFSLRRDFPDAWYALLSQAQANPAALTTQLLLSIRDLPPNLSRFRIEQVTLMVLRPDQPTAAPAQVKVALTLTNGGQPPTVIQTAQAASVDDIISTRSSAAAAWGSLLYQDPTGTWALAFANGDTITGQALQSGDISDVVLVLTYGGDLPPWPTP